jgi:hypothetical protein
VGATTIGIVTRLARAARLVRIADSLTVPFVRRLLQATLGVSLATAMVAGAMPTGSLQAPGDDRATPPAAMPLDADEGGGRSGITPTAASEIELRAVSGDQPDEVTLERVAPSSRPLPLELLDRARDEVRGAADGGVEEAELEEGDVAAGDDRATEHVVVAGDSLWSIAEATLVAADGQRPDGQAVADYWQAVVEANRDALTDPENPDLIFPGQVVQLPEPPA